MTIDAFFAGQDPSRENLLGRAPRGGGHRSGGSPSASTGGVHRRDAGAPCSTLWGIAQLKDLTVWRNACIVQTSSGPRVADRTNTHRWGVMLPLRRTLYAVAVLAFLVGCAAPTASTSLVLPYASLAPTLRRAPRNPWLRPQASRVPPTRRFRPRPPRPSPLHRRVLPPRSPATRPVPPRHPLIPPSRPRPLWSTHAVSCCSTCSCNPLVREARKRREERARHDPSYTHRVGQALNHGRVNIVLFVWGETTSPRQRKRRSSARTPSSRTTMCTARSR